jgi:hypothetical protein
MHIIRQMAIACPAKHCLRQMRNLQKAQKECFLVGLAIRLKSA